MALLKTYTLDDLTNFTRSTTGSYLDVDNILKYAAINTPRFQYSPATMTKGLLIEPASTNRFLYSEDLTNAAWTKTNVTLSANAIVSPDGVQSADKVIETATASVIHEVSQSVAVTSGQPNSFSVFAKAGERTKLQIQGQTTFFTSTNLASFDLTTGVVSGVGAGTTASMEDYGNGWWRCRISVLATATGTGALFFKLLDAAGSATYTGNGTNGLYLWGFQAETNTKRHFSYYPTTTAAATRQADNMLVDRVNDFSRFDKGTLVLTYERNPAIIGTAAALGIFNASPNSGNTTDYYNITINDSTGQMIFNARKANVAQAAVSAGNSVTGRNKICISWDVNNFRASLNGAAVVKDTAGSIITDIDYMQIGAFNGTSWCGTRIFKFDFYPRLLTDAEMQAASTL